VEPGPGGPGRAGVADGTAPELRYHRLSGLSLARLAALSDGIFAVAMTLLVLDVRVPVLDAVHPRQPVWAGGALASEHPLWHALAALAPRLLAYFMSFLTLGIFWSAQQTQLNLFARSDHRLSWINLGFLMSVTLMPFSTALLSEFITYRLALIVYWLNLLLLGAVMFAAFRYAERAGLLTDEAPAGVGRAVRRRIVSYQIGYAVAAALCAVDPYLSIGLIVALQLNSAIAPRIRFLNRF
jgi:uncharacterized membrane protein